MRSATDPSVAQELETDMKKKALAIGGIAVAAALVGGWALAQTVSPGPNGFRPPFMHGQGADGMGPGMTEHMGKGMGHGMMRHGVGPGMMHAPGRGFADAEDIDELKAELGITPAQESAWSKYVRVVQDATAAMKTTREGVDPQAVTKMSPADRFAFVSKMREQGEKQLAAVKEAANELVGTLDDTQKAAAAEILPGLIPLGPAAMRGAGMGSPQHRH
jgi:LTXXQ motif family protein